MTTVDKVRVSTVCFLEGLVDDLKAGRAVVITADLDGEIAQLTPQPDEMYVQSSHTGRYTYTLTYAVPEAEAKHAQKILSRQVER